MLFVVEAGGGRWGSFHSNQTLDIARPWGRPSGGGPCVRERERERERETGLRTCVLRYCKAHWARKVYGRAGAAVGVGGFCPEEQKQMQVQRAIRHEQRLQDSLQAEILGLRRGDRNKKQEISLGR